MCLVFPQRCQFCFDVVYMRLSSRFCGLKLPKKGNLFLNPPKIQDKPVVPKVGVRVKAINMITQWKKCLKHDALLIIPLLVVCVGGTLFILVLFKNKWQFAWIIVCKINSSRVFQAIGVCRVSGMPTLSLDHYVSEAEWVQVNARPKSCKESLVKSRRNNLSCK